MPVLRRLYTGTATSKDVVELSNFGWTSPNAEVGTRKSATFTCDL